MADLSTAADAKEAKAMCEDIQRQVEEVLVGCIGDDAFLDDEGYEDLDLRDEYDLDIYSFAEIVTGLNDRFGIDVAPTSVEWEDICSVSRATELVQDRLAFGGDDV